MDARPIPQPLHVRNFGHGPRRLLALHCTIAHAGAWRGVAARLSDAATMIAPDMLSHGRSPDWDRQGDIHDRMTAAILPLLEPGTDLIGHSFGGTVALRLAAEHPDLVRSLTLIEPVLFAVAAADAPEALDQHNRDAAAVFDAFRAGDDPLAARLFNRMWADDGAPRWPDLPDQTRAAMIRAIHFVPASDAAVMRDRPGLLAPGVLDRVEMPVLLLRGDRTHPIIATVNDGLAHRLPNARNEVLRGAGHMAPITHPQQVADHIAELLSETT